MALYRRLNLQQNSQKSIVYIHIQGQKQEIRKLPFPFPSRGPEKHLLMSDVWIFKTFLKYTHTHTHTHTHPRSCTQHVMEFTMFESSYMLQHVI